MTEGDLILGTILIAGFAWLGLVTTWGWARNARETRRIREALEAWALQELAHRREAEAQQIRPPEDLQAYLADLLARAGMEGVRVQEVTPLPGSPSFRVIADGRAWILSPHLPMRGEGIALDALTTGDRWAAERLRRARMAAEPGLAVPPTERWWLAPEIRTFAPRRAPRRFPILLPLPRRTS
ncbi:hypothetical protein [Thermoflexus hugenholtzii]|uniref:Uncharacterized protein n=1 Tax=Thermoflexus hugenholtzii JAD2 TaxID=877466 RepID=A0A212QMJ7_9CHLR|nr:hypothetical protein [Thermoflexus hugenholtzii]SNB60599.1 hypothetical protein SAMN02746019_00025510 [Thermoflexus hugenholtzii JAD2]